MPFSKTLRVTLRATPAEYSPPSARRARFNLTRALLSSMANPSTKVQQTLPRNGSSIPLSTRSQERDPSGRATTHHNFQIGYCLPATGVSVLNELLENIQGALAPRLAGVTPGVVSDRVGIAPYDFHYVFAPAGNSQHG